MRFVGSFCKVEVKLDVWVSELFEELLRVFFLKRELFNHFVLMSFRMAFVVAAEPSFLFVVAAESPVIHALNLIRAGVIPHWLVLREPLLKAP